MENSSFNHRSEPVKLKLALHHAAHSTHATHAAHSARHSAAHSAIFILRQVGDDTLGGQQHTRYGGRILERGTGYFCRVNDTGCNQVFVLFGRSVEAMSTLECLDLAQR